MASPNEYQPLNMESGSGTRVAEQRNRMGGLMMVGVPLAAVGFAGWIIYSSMQQQGAPSMVTAGDEQFSPPSVPDLMTNEPPPQKDPGVFVVPPSEPPPPPLPPQPPQTVVTPMPPPVAPPAPPPAEPPPPPEEPAPTVIQQSDNGEAARLAELERQRLADEERRRWERLRAKQLIADDGSENGQNAGGENLGGAGPSDASGPVSVQGEAEEEDTNTRFLKNASSTGVDIASATKNPRTDALVPQGTMIRAVLETAIQSDLAGMVRAVTTEDVWSFDGRRVLIPSGTRLIGEYKSGIATGQTRVFIVWTRLLRSDGVSVQLGSIGTDDLGRTGMTGIVDNHYVKKFGSAILLSVVGGATQYLSNLGQRAGQTKTTTIVDPTTGEVTTIEEKPDENSVSAQQIAAQQISQSLQNIAEEALKDNIKIAPTIHVDQGSRVVVFVRRDLDFSSLYADPVKEALRELRRERARLSK